MKVVLRSSSLLFTLLSIVLNAPITRVKPKPENPESEGVPDGAFGAIHEDQNSLTSESAYRLHPRARV